jgi:hypothetical protein
LRIKANIIFAPSPASTFGGSGNSRRLALER